jgi:hypothetical protein
MELMRDVLDSQIFDRKKRPMGKVDGLIMVVRKQKPPRLAFIEVGPATLWGRIHPRLGRWVEAMERRLKIRPEPRERIAWEKVTRIGIDVHVDVAVEETSCYAWERWLLEHIIGKIPGAGHGD